MILFGTTSSIEILFEKNSKLNPKSDTLHPVVTTAFVSDPYQQIYDHFGTFVSSFKRKGEFESKGPRITLTDRSSSDAVEQTTYLWGWSPLDSRPTKSNKILNKYIHPVLAHCHSILDPAIASGSRTEERSAHTGLIASVRNSDPPQHCISAVYGAQHLRIVDWSAQSTPINDLCLFCVDPGGLKLRIEG